MWLRLLYPSALGFQWLCQYKVKTFCMVFLSILIWNHFPLDYVLRHTGLSCSSLAKFPYISEPFQLLFSFRITFGKAASLSFSLSAKYLPSQKRRLPDYHGPNHLQSPTLIVFFRALITIWSMYVFIWLLSVSSSLGLRHFLPHYPQKAWHLCCQFMYLLNLRKTENQYLVWGTEQNLPLRFPVLLR